MKLVIREKVEVAEEGIGSKLKTAAAGLGAAAMIGGVGAGVSNYSGKMDAKIDAIGQLMQAEIPYPTMARGYLKVTGKEFAPEKGQDYKQSLQSAVGGLIAAGKLAVKDGKLVVTGK